MQSSQKKLNPGEILIESEAGITGGVLQVNDAFDLYLVKLPNGNFELRIFMKLQFFFKDDGVNRWKQSEKEAFLKGWEARVRKIWDGHILKVLTGNKIVILKLDFYLQIGGFLLDHWEITVKKTPPGTVFRSFVRPGMKDVTLTANDNNVTIRSVRNVGNFNQYTSTHEFGHMIGLDDEYGPLFGGVAGQHNNDYDSIMNIGTQVRNRHIGQLSQ